MKDNKVDQKPKQEKQSFIKSIELKIDKQSDLTKRLISSIFLAIFVVIYVGLSIIYEEGVVTKAYALPQIAAYFDFGITMVLAGAAAYELMKAMKVLENKNGMLMMIGGIILTMFLVFYPWTRQNTWALYDAMNIASWNQWFMILAVNVFCIVLFLFIGYQTTKSWTKSLLFLVYIYVVAMGFKGFLTIGLAVFTTTTTENKQLSNWKFGWNTIIWAWAIIILTDTFAYLGGRKFGKTLLAPKVSPHKTWEGSGIGSGVAIVFGILYSVLFFYLNAHYSPFSENMNSLKDTDGNAVPGIILALLTIIISLAGQIGDLFFSFYKRMFGIKDFSKLIPGHGGILDRMDSFLFVFFILYLIALASL